MAKGKREAAPPEVKKPRKGRKLLVLLTILCLLAVGAVLVRMYIRPPESLVSAREPEGGASAPSGGSQNAGGGTKKAKNAYTVLLVGQRDGMTDTLMAAMLDLDAKQLNVISIPRDTMVDVSRRVPKINGAYANGGSGEDGMKALLSEISQIIGYTPANYCIVNMKGFEKLVDAIGGVTFNVPVRMYKQYEGIDLQPGEQKLNGNKALQLVRYRGYASNNKAGIDHDDYGRMQVQQMFLKAMLEQTLTLGNISKIPEFISIAGKNLTTDLDAGNIAWFAEQVLKLDSDSISFSTLPTRSINYGDSKIAKGYYEIIDSEKALELINEKINPFKVDITSGMVSHRDPEK